MKKQEKFWKGKKHLKMVKLSYINQLTSMARRAKMPMETPIATENWAGPYGGGKGVGANL